MGGENKSSGDGIGEGGAWTESIIDILEVFCKGIVQECIPRQQPVNIRLH